MENLTKKQSIVQSLESMNQMEMKKVIDYIRNLLYLQENDRSYQTIKKQALEEINQALITGS
jgi:hypothetical protein